VHWEGKWELIGGIPMAMAPAPIINHQAIANLMAFELMQWVNECEECLVLNEEDSKLNEDTVLKPDVVLICDEPNEKYITKAPKIVVEVISPSTAKRDEKYKFELYEKEKVLYCVLAYPNDLKAKVYKLENGSFVKEGDFTSESYQFDNAPCSPTVNFDFVFKRFRNK
jgi:Uma2 family endonuclease